MICKLRTLWSTAGLETHVGDFSNYHHVNIFNFLLMNNISNYRNVRRIMSRCCEIRCRMWPRPSFMTFSNWIRNWLIELLMNFFVSLSHAYDIAVDSPSMSLYHFTFLYSIFFMMSQIAYQADWTRIKRLIFRSDIISDIFIDIIGNKIVLWQQAPSCWIVNFFHKINSLLHKYVSSAFQVIIAINSHTIFYKEQQAFSKFS